MAISDELIELLACPICRRKVVLSAAGNSIVCHDCNRLYPVVDDIPVMMVDESTPVTEPENPSGTRS